MDMSGLQTRFDGENHKLVECEYCDNCINMTEIEYKKIMNEIEHIHWFCPPCDVKVVKTLKIEKKNCEERCEEFL